MWWKALLDDLDEFPGVPQEIARELLGKRPRTKAEALGVIGDHLNALETWREALHQIVGWLDQHCLAQALKELALERTGEKASVKLDAMRLLVEYYFKKAGSPYTLAEIDKGVERRSAQSASRSRTGLARGGTVPQVTAIEEAEEEPPYFDAEYIATLSPGERQYVLITNRPEPDGIWSAIKSLMGPKPVRVPASIAESLRWRFDDGFPKDNHLYVRDPLKPDFYVTAAAAPDFISREKINAYIRIAISLGARRIELVAAESSQLGTQLSLEGAVVHAGISGKVSKEHGVTRTVVIDFDQLQGKPQVPDELRVWVESDPDLKTLEHTAMTNRQRSIELKIETSEALQVEARVSGLASWGNLGGEIKRCKIKSLRFRVDFVEPLSSKAEVANLPGGKSGVAPAEAKPVSHAEVARPVLVGHSAAPAPPSPPSPATLVREFYIHLNGQQMGPFDLAYLARGAASGHFTAATPVWRKGFASWVAAGEIPELSHMFEKRPW